MHKTLKQMKVTFTTISLFVLFCVSVALFLAQIAAAQTGMDAETTYPEAHTA